MEDCSVVRPEVLSTARPGRLRLAGFLVLVAGALAAGVGAALTWASIGFPGDTAHAGDVAVAGIDVWEGVVVLGVAALALVLLIASRLTSSPGARRAIAGAIGAGGALVVVLTSLDLATARSRFGGATGLDQVARRVAEALGQPVERVRPLLERNFGSTLRVDVGIGLPVALLGGVALVVAARLALAWARSSAPVPREEPSTDGLD
jgi:hypothetical protein